MTEVPKDGDYFVFDYYTNQSLPNSLLIPLILRAGKLEGLAEFGSSDPELHHGSKKCLTFLRGRGITKVFSVRYGDSMYSELYGFPIHFSAGEGRYAFHYDFVKHLEGIEIVEIPAETLLPEEKEKRRQMLVGMLG